MENSIWKKRVLVICSSIKWRLLIKTERENSIHAEEISPFGVKLRLRCANIATAFILLGARTDLKKKEGRKERKSGTREDISSKWKYWSKIYFSPGVTSPIHLFFISYFLRFVLFFNSIKKKIYFLFTGYS